MPTPVPPDQTTPPDLDQIMLDGMTAFDAELTTAAGPDSTDDAPPAAPSADLTPPDPAETSAPAPPEISAPAASPVPAAVPPKPDGAVKPSRFADHAAAERGYQHIQAVNSRLAAENKALKEKEKAAADARKAAETAAAADQDLTEYAAGRYQKCLADINALDPDADDYDTQVATIWAEKDRDVLRRARTWAPPPDSPAPPAAADPSAVPPAAADPSAVPPAAADPAAADPSVLIATIHTEAQAAGIDPNDEYFKLVCQATPTTDAQGNPLTFRQQLAQAITKTKNYHAAQLAHSQAMRHQDTTLPIGRGGPPPPAPPAPVRPMSISDALASAMEGRRL